MGYLTSKNVRLLTLILFGCGTLFYFFVIRKQLKTYHDQYLTVTYPATWKLTAYPQKKQVSLICDDSWVLHFGPRSSVSIIVMPNPKGMDVKAWLDSEPILRPVSPERSYLPLWEPKGPVKKNGRTCLVYQFMSEQVAYLVATRSWVYLVSKAPRGEASELEIDKIVDSIKFEE